MYGSLPTELQMADGFGNLSNTHYLHGSLVSSIHVHMHML